MFRIYYIELINFRGKPKVTFKLADDQVSIIYGRNGSGKTTFLKVIHGILSMNESILKGEDIEKATIVFKNSKNHSLVHLTAEAIDNEESSYIWSSDANDIDEFVQSLSSIVFGVNRGITTTQSSINLGPSDIHQFFLHRNLKIVNSNDTKKSNVVFEDLSEYVNSVIKMRSRRNRRLKMDFNQENEKNLMLESVSMDYVETSLLERYKFEKRSVSQRVQRALFETLALVLENSTSNAKILPSTHETIINKLNNYKGTLLEVLEQLEENEVSNKIKHILYNYTNDMEGVNPFEGKDLLLTLVGNMIDELEKGEGLLNTVKLIDVFNTYLTDDKKLVIDENGVYIRTLKAKHDIERLSSGERHLLSFLTLFLINGKDRKIWMIDEPEISLHLEWQSKLLNVLTGFVPDAQIIVATHSPAIAEYGTDKLVELKL